LQAHQVVGGEGVGRLCILGEGRCERHQQTSGPASGQQGGGGNRQAHDELWLQSGERAKYIEKRGVVVLGRQLSRIHALRSIRAPAHQLPECSGHMDVQELPAGDAGVGYFFSWMMANALV
jgi:hypothetical protein